MPKAIFNSETMGLDESTPETVNLVQESEDDVAVADAIAQINNIGGGAGGKDKSQASEDELEEMKITDEETELASQMIFRGYAEKDFVLKVVPDAKFTITTSSAEEVDIVNNITFNFIHKNSDEEGKTKFSERELISLKTSLSIALSYKGINGEDISTEPISKLASLKAGIKKMSTFAISGDLEGSESLKKTLHKAILSRASMIRELPTAIIDVISKEKYDFDERMYKVMSIGGIIPK